MKKLNYSPDAREKMKQIRQNIKYQFGIDTADKVMKEMTKSIRDLQQFENKGVSVESFLDIPCNYRMLIVQHNYVFYQVNDNVIKIIDIYHEKEDFMWKLFGIKTTTEETENYWGE